MSSKREDVYARLRDDILSGRLDPGQPISERSAAEAFGASRVPLREALIQLERDGLVTVAQHRGAFVRSFTPSMLQNLYELRQALEGLAAEKAASLVGPDAMTPHVRRFQRALAVKNPDAKTIERDGFEFHEAILVGCANPLIEETVARIRDQVTVAKRMTYLQSDEHWLRRSAQEHLGIAEAVRDGEGALAGQRMIAHIAAWSLRFGSQFTESPAPSHPPNEE